MGFPVGYTEVFIPTLLIHTLTLLTLLKNLLFALFHFLRLPIGDVFLDIPVPVDPPPPHSAGRPSFSAVLLRELLPIAAAEDTACCAVCLCDVPKGEEIRWLANCRHAFHRDCLDRWIDLDQRTCPLCRTPFLRGQMLEEFNQRLMAAEVYDHSMYVDHTVFSPQYHL